MTPQTHSGSITQVPSLRSKICFGGQTKSLVQTSIFNLDKYLWQLQYYFKPLLFSRLQVESKIEKIPSPPHHPLLSQLIVCDKVGHTCLLISLLLLKISARLCFPSLVISVGLSKRNALIWLSCSEFAWLLLAAVTFL